MLTRDKNLQRCKLFWSTLYIKAGEYFRTLLRCVIVHTLCMRHSQAALKSGAQNAADAYDTLHVDTQPKI